MQTSIKIKARGKHVAIDRYEVNETPGGIQLPDGTNLPTRDEPLTGTVVSVGEEADFEKGDVVVYISRSATYEGYDLVHKDAILATMDVEYE